MPGAMESDPERTSIEGFDIIGYSYFRVRGTMSFDESEYSIRVTGTLGEI